MPKKLTKKQSEMLVETKKSINKTKKMLKASKPRSVKRKLLKIAVDSMEKYYQKIKK